MSSMSQRFVLVGPHKGKTMAIGKHQFKDGEYVFQGSMEQVITLTKIFADYAAVPEQQARMMELEAELARPASAPEVLLQKPTEAPTATPTPAPTVAPTPAPTEAPKSEAVDLGTAIGQLDPENEAHWTSNNLPSLDALATIVGKKPSRDDVDAIADGYTRAKAKAARA